MKSREGTIHPGERKKERERERESECERGVIPIVSRRIEIFETLCGLCKRSTNSRGKRGEYGGGKARQGKARQDKARRVKAQHGSHRMAHEGGVARVQIMQRMTRHRTGPAPSHLPDETLLSLLSFLSFFLSFFSSSFFFPLGVLHSCYMHHRTGVLRTRRSRCRRSHAAQPSMRSLHINGANNAVRFRASAYRKSLARLPVSLLA